MPPMMSPHGPDKPLRHYSYETNPPPPPPPIPSNGGSGNRVRFQEAPDSLQQATKKVCNTKSFLQKLKKRHSVSHILIFFSRLYDL